MTTDWDDLRIILAAARAGSFAEAARLLAINESTVIRRLAQAEERFAARLFERRRGRLVATAAGAMLIERARRVDAEYEAAREAIAGTDRRVAGNVRLTAVPLLVNHVLMPALPALFDAHPDIRLELIAEARCLSLEDREADIALRFARPRTERHCITRKVADIRYGIYAAAGHDPDALPWIGYEAAMKDLPQMRWMAEEAAAGVNVRLRVNDAESLLSAIRRGQGKGFLPLAIGNGMAELRRVDGQGRNRQRELWLMMHGDLRGHPRIRTVVDWVIALFGEWSSLAEMSGIDAARARYGISSATTAASLAASSGLCNTSSMPAAM